MASLLVSSTHAFNGGCPVRPSHPYVPWTPGWSETRHRFTEKDVNRNSIALQRSRMQLTDQPLEVRTGERVLPEHLEHLGVGRRPGQRSGIEERFMHLFTRAHAREDDRNVVFSKT